MNTTTRQSASLPSITMGIIVAAVAVLTTGSLCAAAFGIAMPKFAIFGSVLFGAYGWSSFLIPFHLLAAAILLFFPSWNPKNCLILLFSVFPFFSVVVAERILKIQADYSFTRILGTGGICFLTAVVIAIEYTAAWFASTGIAKTIDNALQTYDQQTKTSDLNDLLTESAPELSDASTDELTMQTADFATETANSSDQSTSNETQTHIFSVPPVLKSRTVFNRIFEDHAEMETKFGDYIHTDIPDVQEESDESFFETNDTKYTESQPNDEINCDPYDSTLVTEDFETLPESPETTELPVQTLADDQLEEIQPEKTLISVDSDAPLTNIVVAQKTPVTEEESDQPETDRRSPQVEYEQQEPINTIVESPACLHIGMSEHRPLNEYEAILEGRPFNPEQTESISNEDSTDGDKSSDNFADTDSDDVFEFVDTDDIQQNDSDITNDNHIPIQQTKSNDMSIDFDSDSSVDALIDVDATSIDNVTTDEIDTDFIANDADAEVSIDTLLSDAKISNHDEITPQEKKLLATTTEVPHFSRNRRYEVPVDGLLTAYPDGQYWVIDDATRDAAAVLKETLNEFKIDAEVTGIRKGPVITMFEILPAPGVKLQRIAALQDNIALRLAASSIRIIAPIPGKHAVGIEVPNEDRAIVSFREMIEAEPEAAAKMAVPVVLGKGITGETQYLDLAQTPHLLIAGSTGAGKSVCVNSMILSILYKRSPADVRMILIDPKIVELKLYNDIPHLLTPVITEPKRAFQALQYCLCEMERRYAVLDGMGVRDIKNYNRRIKERNIATEKLPYIIVIIDEFADLMATTGKELESTIARLAAMSRAVGIHLVLATQRPSIDVITGLIKANIPSRIAFMVASKMDSRIIIDQVGAEKLLGKGDMLYASAVSPFPERIQGAFVTDGEVEKVVAYVRQYGEPDYIDDEIFYDEEDDEGTISMFGDEGDDPLYEKALEIVMQAGKASASYIQRRLKIGYNRAARLVEEMEARGIVGPANGSKPRDVIHPM